MRTISIMVLLLAAICRSEPLTNAQGIVYDVQSVTRVEPDGVTFRHSKGIVKLAFSELPQRFREQYNYNPTNAVAYSSSQRNAQAAFLRKSEIQTEKRAGPVRLEEHRGLVTKAAKVESMNIAGRVWRVFPNALVINSVSFEVQKPADWRKVNATYRSRGMLPPYSGQDDAEYRPMNQDVIVFCQTAGWYEDKLFSAKVVEAGTDDSTGRTLRAFKLISVFNP